MNKYIAGFVVIFTLLFFMAVPFHSFKSSDFGLFGLALGSGGKLVMLGNSVNRTVSRCDADKRTIPDMLNDAGVKVANYSRGGMQTGEMVHFADLLISIGVRPKIIVFPISPESGFFRSVLLPAGLASFFEKGLHKSASGASLPPEEYEGILYGKYSEFSRTYFVKEKSHVTCSDSTWANPKFVRFMYWRNFLQVNDPLDGFAEFLSRSRAWEGRGVRVIVWMTPVNFEDLRSLHGQDAVEKVANDLRRVRDKIKLEGIAVIDSSAIVPAEGFTDRWCACGHLSDRGRALVVRSFAEVVRDIGVK